MEYDVKKVARVWQRVQSEKQESVQPQKPPVQALILEQLQLSLVYLQLARQLPGKEGTEFVRLAREARAQALCLKGIVILSTGATPDTSCPPPRISSVDAALRSCYGKELRLVREYEGRTNDAEYGPAFRRMAQQGEAHCCAVLELIGKLLKTK